MAGGVLLDQTLVCEAARLLQPGNGQLRADRYDPWRNAERLTQLSLLLDAIMLYDRAHTLRAELPPDADGLALRRALIAAGIVTEVDTSECNEAVATELWRFFAASARRENPDARYVTKPAPEDVARGMVQAALAGEPYAGPRLGFVDSIVDCLRRGLEADPRDHDLTELDGYGHRPPRRTDDPVAAMAGRLMNLAYSGTSGSVIPSAATQLRTFVYWRLSAHLKLPFYPSVQRLPDYHLIANHLRRTVQDEVYGAVAESFRATVSEVYEDDLPVPVYLPPALTLFLDHVRRGHDVSDAIRRLRAESEPLRRALVRLQESRARATSLRELHAARSRFAEVSAQFQLVPHNVAESAIDQVMDMAPGIAAAAANPLDVRSYTTALLKTPRDWIRGWWRRRPYRPAFQLRDRLLAVRDFAELFTESTGIELDAEKFTGLAETYDWYAQRLPVYGRARRPGSL
jgi:hypothetical protein